MRGVTHALAGLTTGLLISSNPFAVATAVFASLLPDIDESSSFFGRYVPILGTLFKHRGFFHSLLFLLGWLLILLLIAPPVITLSFAGGFLSHLLLDSTTRSGVRITPLGTLRGPFRTGGIIEYVVRGLLLAAILYLLLQ